MIALSGALAGYEAITRLLHPQAVTNLWAVAAAAVVGFLGNELVAHYRILVGRRIGSAALVADGLHARADGFTSLAVLLGAGGVALGWTWADPAVGLLITIATARAGLGAVDGIQDIDDLRLRWIGHRLRAEASVTVDPVMSVSQAQEVAHHAEAHLVTYVKRLSAATVHVSPHGSH
jgi:divalent metal cation (Fe/Co/Zn/Cd) transporter